MNGWSHNNKHYLIIPRLGDPLFEPGRARLIWAANTAEATHRLGYPSALCGVLRRSFNPMQLKREPVWTRPPERFRQFYDVSEAFRIFSPRLFLHGPRALDAVNPLSRYGARKQLIRQLLSIAGCLHTRDWTLVELAVSQGIPTIFEDHAESFHVKVNHYPQAIIRSPYFLLAVAISDEARERMCERGMPLEKVMLLPSGLNRKSFERSPQASELLRERYLQNGFRRLIVYSGGLYRFRGVDMLLEAAASMPETYFLICGGRDRQVKSYQRKQQLAGVLNIEFAGYLEHVDLTCRLQAADLLVLPYADPDVAQITSPLKFFEYLAAGVPVVSARMPMLSSFFNRDDLAVEWTDIGDTDGLVAGLKSALERFPRRADGYERNRQAARHYTWDERQRRLFKRLESTPAWPPVFTGGSAVVTSPRAKRESQGEVDLCFVISEYNRGWVLETICKRVETYYPGSTDWSWTRKNRSFTGEIANARRYWFSHFQLLLTCLKQFPWLKERELYVWYTHPSKDEIPLCDLVEALNYCHRVIFTCSLHRDEMLRYGVRPEIAEVVLGGADPELFKGHTRGQGKVGFCSAYYPRKSPEIIMELVQRMPHCEFLLVGPQPDGMRTTERMWTNYPKFSELFALPNLEYVEAPYSDYPKYYAQMDVFVMPSRLEGGPIPLLEAMMCNVVPVSSRTGFAPDLIDDGQNGFLFNVEEPVEAVVERVEKAFELQTDIRSSVLPYSWKGFTERIVEMQD